MTALETAASRGALVTRLLEGDGRAASDLRRRAFDARGLPEPLATIVHKIGTRPTEINAEDIAAARAAGLTEDQLFEVIVCAAVGQAMRQHDAALAAVDAASTQGG
jgi:hypothetical protein